MNAIISALQAIIRTIFEFFHLGYGMTQPPPRDPALRAEFETDQKVLSIFNEGFCVDGKRSLSLKDSFRHVMIIGKSGIGKSTSTYISSLLTMHTSGSSFVVHDPSGELLKVCGGHLKAQGYQVKALDFGNSKRSIGFNPLPEGSTEKLAGMVVRTTSNSSDKFWDTSSEHLINNISKLALSLPEEGHHNLSNVLRLIKMINGNRKRFNEIVAKHADDKLYLDISAFLANDAKVLAGIVASASAALGIFSDPDVATVTSRTTLDFKDFRKKKVALFVQNKVSSLEYYNPIISIFFETFFASLLENIPKDTDKSIYFLLDEFASGLVLPSFSNCISHFRKYRVGACMGIQSIEQLRIAYKPDAATNIMANCYLHMYFSEQSHSTAKMLEEMLGRYNFEDDGGNKNLVRNLMEANEIRMLGKNKAIIIAGSEKPILAQLTPFYERLWLKMRANLPEPKLHGVGFNSSLAYVE